MLVCSISYAQSPQQVRVKIETTIDNQTQLLDTVISINDMSDVQQFVDAHVPQPQAGSGDEVEVEVDVRVEAVGSSASGSRIMADDMSDEDKVEHVMKSLEGHVDAETLAEIRKEMEKAEGEEGSHVVIMKKVDGEKGKKGEKTMIVKHLEGDDAENGLDEGELKKILEEAGVEGLDVKIKKLEEAKDGEGKKKFIQITESVDVEEMEEGGEKRKIVRVMTMVMLKDVSDEEMDIVARSGLDVNELETSLELEELSFHPNPNNGLFALRFKTSRKASLDIRISDINGKLVYNEKASRFKGTYEKEIDLTNQPKGVYFLSIVHGKEMTAKKIVIE